MTVDGRKVIYAGKKSQVPAPTYAPTYTYHTPTYSYPLSPQESLDDLRSLNSFFKVAGFHRASLMMYVARAS